MSHRSTSYTERNGLGATMARKHHAPPSAARVRAVNAWFAVWHELTAQQQANWRALSRADQESTKQLSADVFRDVMTAQPTTETEPAPLPRKETAP